MVNSGHVVDDAVVVEVRCVSRGAPFNLGCDAIGCAFESMRHFDMPIQHSTLTSGSMSVSLSCPSL